MTRPFEIIFSPRVFYIKSLKRHIFHCEKGGSISLFTINDVCRTHITLNRGELNETKQFQIESERRCGFMLEGEK